MSIEFREIFAKAGSNLAVRLELFLGSRLIDLATNQNALAGIVRLRTALLKDGYELPIIRVRDRGTLDARDYEIESDGVIVASGQSEQFDEILDDLAEIVRTHAILSECLQ
ncbi:MAG: hypothetical protein IT428_06330 [Planctomycetaceae bacterium]|nr:hypothetical protein [Planctomycetaceae bacterium]